jgi:hypothetical protein
MKQYTNEIQTAKLIELGFKKPKNTQYVQRAKARNLHSPFIEFGEPEFEGSYSIGELIEMLPEAICKSNDDSYHYFLSIETDSLTWKVFYESEDEVTLCSTFGVELVDALCSMLTILKRQGTL